MERPADSCEMHEAELSPEKVALATTTFYPKWPTDESDYIRGHLALRSIDAALVCGYHVCIVDGGSSPEFQEELKKRKIVLEAQHAPGMSESRRQVFFMAECIPSAEVICWVEPEKVSLVEDGLLADAVKPILRGEADIVIPSRTDASWDSYPSYQKESEKKANAHLNGILQKEDLLKEGEQLDLFFGPRFFSKKKEVADFFFRQFALKGHKDTKLGKKMNPDAYSNGTFYSVANALRAGLRVKSIPIEYRHPPEQTHLESGNALFDKKRDTQRRTIVAEMIDLLRYQKKSTRSRLLEKKRY